MGSVRRRSFLGTLAGIAAISSLPLSAHDLPENAPTQDFLLVDDFSSKGWRIRWRGWRTPFNQTILFGVWMAYREDSPEGQYWVSTTLGHCGSYREFDVFDTTYYKEHGTKLNPFSSERDRLAAKRLALMNLFESLKTGRPIPDHV